MSRQLYQCMNCMREFATVHATFCHQGRKNRTLSIFASISGNHTETNMFCTTSSWFSHFSSNHTAKNQVHTVCSGCVLNGAKQKLVLVGETVTKECHPGRRGCRCDCPAHTANSNISSNRWCEQNHDSVIFKIKGVNKIQMVWTKISNVW